MRKVYQTSRFVFFKKTKQIFLSFDQKRKKKKKVSMFD